MAQESYEPSKFDKFWYKMEDILIPIFVPIFALIGDAAVIYTIYYFSSVGMPYAWLWTILLLGITVPILYIFNRGAIEFIKNGFRRKKKEEK